MKKSMKIVDQLPLAVDLDGTLVKTDTLLESFLALLRQNIFYIFLMPFWLIKGKAFLKHEIAKRINIDITSLPYNRNFLTFLIEEHSHGRPLILATASDLIIARKIADHLSIFSDVLASNGKDNMKGSNKLKALKDKFGDKGFDYAGNEYVDIKIWAGANSAIVVNGSKRLAEAVREITPVSHIFNDRKSPVKVFFHAIRVHQWAKNLLVFIPLFAVHKWADYPLLRDSIYAFAAFSIIASSVYLLNDLWDMENDRHHHNKRERPFASGDLSLFAGMVMVPLLLIGSIVVSLLLPLNFLFILGIYYVITLTYSFYLKRVVLVDVIILAVLYTLRIIAGGMATGISISQWLLAFSVFLFVSLAFAKRFSELYILRKNNKEMTKGRGYFAGDLDQLAIMGSASGYIAVLVLALYMNSSEIKMLYKQPELLWLICPLFLYWISRVWLLTHRGDMHDDPIIFAVKDRVTYLIGLCVVGIVMIAAV